ncbi:MAG: hypothetical protein NTY31_00920 [Candidatus Falkowbacteria bacterium]|nr:hypothetical protein [Candidatus Falkowbacteria bacterium]
MKKLEIGFGIMSLLTGAAHCIFKNNEFAISGVVSLVTLGVFLTAFVIMAAINVPNPKWEKWLFSSSTNLALGILGLIGFIMYCIFYRGI